MRLWQTRRHLLSLMISLLALLTVRWNGFTLPVWLDEISSSTVVSRLNTRDRVVALTFDDGPDSAYTPRILQILQRYNAKATFFVEGRMVHKYPYLVRLELAAGHALGNHTDTHPYLERMPLPAVRSEIERCNKSLQAAAGVRSYLFRPPRGNWNPTIYREVARQNCRIILWSVALEHESTPRPEAMAAKVLSHVQPGSVILMHDGGSTSRESTVAALPLLLDGLRAKGYRCVSFPGFTDARGDFPI